MDSLKEDKIKKILESYKKTREYQKQYCKDNLEDFRIRNRQYYDKNKENPEFMEKRREQKRKQYQLRKEKNLIVEMFNFLPNVI